MRATVIALILAVTTNVAVAQPGMTAPIAAPPPPPQSTPPKSGDTATLLAIAGTVTPFLIVALAADNESEGGVLLGFGAALLLPSAGHWYAGKVVTAGMGLRLLGGGVAGGSIYLLVASDGGIEGAEKTFWLGAATYVVGAVYDIATASSAADDWNAKHTVQPTLVRTGDGYGVGFRGRF